MVTTFLERLPRLVAIGRRQAQRLGDAAGGRHREYAVPVELLLAPDDPLPPNGTPPRRLLCGLPAACVAALLAEHRQGGGTKIGGIVVDLYPASDGEPFAARLARWIPCLALLRALAPQAPLTVHVPPKDRAILTLVLDALALRESQEPAVDHDSTTLLVADDGTRLPALARARMQWVACTGDAAGGAALRRTLLQRGDTTFRIEAVGATPTEWTRRHAASNPMAAMRAALAAFGGTPVAESSACPTPTGRRRAGNDVLLGETTREGIRTLVWVDGPDRRTGESTLCRAITRREHQAYDRVVILGWHFAPTLGQHLMVRGDARVEVRAVRTLPLGERGGLRIDPRGFECIDGLGQAWVDRRRSRSAPDIEWLAVQLGEDLGEPIVDWAIDPQHDGEVFRGAWHALRDGPGLRQMRLRLPVHDAPRRVCVRAIGADGRVSELLFVVPALERADAQRDEPPRAVPARAPVRTRVEALC